MEIFFFFAMSSKFLIAPREIKLKKKKKPPTKQIKTKQKTTIIKKKTPREPDT